MNKIIIINYLNESVYFLLLLYYKFSLHHVIENISQQSQWIFYNILEKSLLQLKYKFKIGIVRVFQNIFTIESGVNLFVTEKKPFYFL